MKLNFKINKAILKRKNVKQTTAYFFKGGSFLCHKVTVDVSHNECPLRLKTVSLYDFI